jgi:hypothetical protein
MIPNKDGKDKVPTDRYDYCIQDAKESRYMRTTQELDTLFVTLAYP